MYGFNSHKLSPELQAVLNRLGPLQDLSQQQGQRPAVQAHEGPGQVAPTDPGTGVFASPALLEQLRSNLGGPTPVATLPQSQGPMTSAPQQAPAARAPMSPEEVVEMRSLPRRAPEEPQGRKVSPWRVIDGVLTGGSISGSLDAERARNARLDYADQMQASFADGVTPDELMELRMGMLPLASRGVDVSGHAKALEAIDQQIQMREFLQTVPEDQRASAALDPTAFADWQREGARPQFFSVGGNLVAANPQTGQATPAWTAPVTPDPPTTDRVLAAALDKMGRGLALSPGEQRIVDRYISGEPPSASEREPTPTRILGAIQDKIARGVALNEGERQIYEDSKLGRLDPLTAMMLGGLPGPPEIPGAPAMPGAPAIPGPPEIPGAPGRGAASQRGSGQVSKKGGIYYPQSAEDMAQVPKGARYVNPANGAVLVKAR